MVLKNIKLKMIARRDFQIKKYLEFNKRFRKMEQSKKGFLSYSEQHTNAEIIEIYKLWNSSKIKQVDEWIKEQEQEDIKEQKQNDTPPNNN